jgi:hypothetical protein
VERVVGTWSCWTLMRRFVSRIGSCELRRRPSRPVRQPITCAEMVQTKSLAAPRGRRRTTRHVTLRIRGTGIAVSA